MSKAKRRAQAINRAKFVASFVWRTDPAKRRSSETIADYRSRVGVGHRGKL